MTESAARRLVKLQQDHSDAMITLADEASAMFDAAWDAMSKDTSAANIDDSFAKLEQLGREIIGQFAPQVLIETGAYIEAAFGFKTEAPSIADQGATISDFVRLLAEHRRHAVFVATVRVKRMQREGVSAEVISDVIRTDFVHGGQLFGTPRNAIRQTIRQALNVIGKQVEFSLRPADADTP